MKAVLLATLVMATGLGGAGCARSAAVATRCGAEIAREQLWAERSDADIESDMQRALACARTNGRRVLLEFVATWCADCRVMTDIDQTPTVRAVLQRRYERVRINVTDWDGHAAIRGRYGIDRIAAYVVLDPATGQRIAQTTVEPATAGTPMTPELWARWLENPRAMP